MPEESAVEAWLNLPSTKREIDIVRKRFGQWTERGFVMEVSKFEAACFVLQMEILVSLDFSPIEVADDEATDPDEPWKPAA